MQGLSAIRRWAIVAVVLPVALLTGCPQSRPVAANAPPSATAPALSSTSQSAAAAETETQSAADAEKDRQAQQLIAQADSAYNSGVQNYRAGRLDTARADFDRAVDMMLTSGMDLKSDSQLSDEFDRLLNSINSLEMAALKQGNGFSPPIEEAPIDTANEVTFPPDAALTAKVQEELKTTPSDFPLLVNDYVAGFINFFSNSKQGHATLMHSLERAGKYKDMIQHDLQDAGLPQDLIYLAVMESGFQPQAVNAQSGAGGMWQFMPFASAYGLTRNGWVDERFDPEKSSQAYARYMKTLYNQFGDWYLAMAAYNWGPGNVQRAVMRTGYADFWELYKRNALPTQTKNYVPGIIAAIIMAKNPAQYGLEGLVPEPAVTSDTVTVNSPVDLQLVADITGSSLADIVALNPGLLRMTTPQDQDYDLHIPAGTRDLFLKRLASVPDDKRTSWRFHVVKAGESLDSVAILYHSRATEIARVNQIDADASVAEGDELVVPAASVSNGLHPRRYKTRAGDSLVTIADRFNVSVEELRRWNHLSSATVRAGRTLAVSQPVRLAPATHVRSRRSRTSSSGRLQRTASSHSTPVAHSSASLHAKHSATQKRASSRKK